MKRLHVHVGVEDIAKATEFYSALFNQKPERAETDYAKWLLDEPQLNFAISTRVAKGIDHLGIELDSTQAVAGLRKDTQLGASKVLDEGETTCCYAKSDKFWLKDPSNISWEIFNSFASLDVFSENANTDTSVKKTAGMKCCG